MTKRNQLTVAVAVSALVWATPATFSPAAADPQTTGQAAGQSTAQTGEGELGEVVVTARRSAERLQDIPLAITAVSSETLTEDHAVGLEDVANLTPGLKFTSFLDSVNGNITIRGLQQENVQSPIGNVGAFLDGIYLQRGFMVDSTLGDFQRIEVVKGPQSALYGENTFGGAVNYVLNQPSDEFKLDASATAGNGQLTEAKIGIGGPIIKGILDGRVYAASSDFNGIVPNAFPGATGENQYFGGHRFETYSGSLKFTPTDALTINGFYDYGRRFYQIQPFYTIDGDSPEDHLNCGAPANNGIPGQQSLWCGSLPTNTAAFRTASSVAPPGLSFLPQPGTTSVNEVAKIAGSYRVDDSLTVNYTYGNARGTSLEQASFSTDPTRAYNAGVLFPAGVGVLAVQREGGELAYQSHEVRVVYAGPGAFTGEVGYFYSRADDQEAFGLLFTAVDSPYLSETNDPLSFAGEAVPFFKYNEHYTTNSPFGRLKWSFLDSKADLAAEVRYTSTRLSFEDVFADTIEFAANPPPPLNSTYNNVTPRFTADYKVGPDELAYFSAARGVKDGGFNGYESSFTPVAASQQRYGEETNWTYEAGWKATYLEHTLVVDADFFYVDWKNRVEAILPAGYAGGVNSQAAGVVPTIYANVGNATSYGIELSTQWKPTSNWAIAEALSVQNPRFSGTSLSPSFDSVCTPALCKFAANGVPNVSGNELPLVSQFTNDIEVDYLGAVGDWTYRVGLNEQYRGMQYVDDINTAKLAAFWLTDGHATFGKDAVKITLWTKNLFNREYTSASFSIPSIYQYNVNLGEPRTYGLTLSVSL